MEVALNTDNISPLFDMKKLGYHSGSFGYLMVNIFIQLSFTPYSFITQAPK
uniref:Uncharacterized protein n=1 Tax=Solanum tuberosum TaxID=4113 RepID=M1D4Z5_SOLTU